MIANMLPVSLYRYFFPPVEALGNWKEVVRNNQCLNFVGRSQEMREIQIRLRDVGFCFVSGAPGIGKSQLLWYWIESVKDQYEEIRVVSHVSEITPQPNILFVIDGIDTPEAFDQLFAAKYPAPILAAGRFAPPEYQSEWFFRLRGLLMEEAKQSLHKPDWRQFANGEGRVHPMRLWGGFDALYAPIVSRYPAPKGLWKTLLDDPHESMHALLHRWASLKVGTPMEVCCESELPQIHTLADQSLARPCANRNGHFWILEETFHEYLQDRKF